MTDIDTAEKALRAAKDALTQIDRECAKEISSARQEIELRWSDRKNEARRKVGEAQVAFDTARENGPRHEWDGKRVFSIRSSGSAWSRKQTRIEGVVETRTKSSVFPSNLRSWNTPQYGEPFVRLLKKDGTVGVKIETNLNRWRLA